MSGGGATLQVNNFELTARISPRNLPDRLVMYPNGKWRRECQTGWYMSYLFGLRAMSINDDFIFLA